MTTDNIEYDQKKQNFKTYNRILHQSTCIRDAKNLYYSNTFTNQKNDMKKMCGTINEALNRGKQKSDFPTSFTMNCRELTDSLEIANEFNIFFLANVSTNSSFADAAGVDTHCEDFTYSDYLNNPTVTLNLT